MTPIARRRALAAVCWLCHQAYELVGSECEHAEHAVAHHFRGTTNPDMATTELVLESAIDALTRRTLGNGNPKRDPSMAT